MAVELARNAHRAVSEVLRPEVHFTEERTKLLKGEQVTKIVPVYSETLKDISLLMREWNRIALSATADSIAEHEARLKTAAGEGDKATSGRIAGSFTVGDQMYGGDEPPELPDGGARNLEWKRLRPPGVTSRSRSRTWT